MKQLDSVGCKPIHCNWLFTYAYARKSGFQQFSNVIIFPDEDALSQVEIDGFKHGMTKYRSTIAKIGLQEFVASGITCRNDRINNVKKEFKGKCLNC